MRRNEAHVGVGEGDDEKEDSLPEGILIIIPQVLDSISILVGGYRPTG
jgi:hypothetical protein